MHYVIEYFRYHCTSIIHTLYIYMVQVPYISFTYTYIHHQTLLLHFNFFSKTRHAGSTWESWINRALELFFLAESWDVDGNYWIQVPLIHLKSILNLSWIHLQSLFSISNPPKNQNLSNNAKKWSSNPQKKTSIPFFVCFMETEVVEPGFRWSLREADSYRIRWKL